MVVNDGSNGAKRRGGTHDQFLKKTFEVSPKFSWHNLAFFICLFV